MTDKEPQGATTSGATPDATPDPAPAATTSLGSLVLVGTPIGNLGDLSPRAAEALSAADVIACEDTRRTGKLLAHAGIGDTRLLVVNDHTEFDSAAGIVNLLAQGQTVAVVTDAGLPGISDPGERLVAAAIDAGHAVTVIPGPSAGVTALVGSGLPTARHVFEGFLPRKGSARAERLLALASEERTVVLYESPRRLERTLTDLSNVYGPERQVVVARELTKLHEQYWRGTLSAAAEWAREPVKGEVVIVVDGAEPPAEATDDVIVDELRMAIADGTSTRDAVANVSERLGVARNRAYDLANTLNE